MSLSYRKSDSIFILGNGPSLRGFDFSLIKKCDSIGMNVAFRYWQKINWYPDYYTCLDDVMIQVQRDNIYNLVQNKNNKIKLFFLRKQILEYHPDLQSNPRVIYFDDYMLSPIFSSISDSLTTGSFAALFAAMLGYKKIYLLGIDLNQVEKLPESESVGGNVLRITETPKNNPNYFFDDYQIKGEQYNIPNSTPNLHYKSWVTVKERLNKFGVNVINCNPNSKLDIFDVYPITHILKQLNSP